MSSYLVLLTDRAWKSEWRAHEQEAPITTGSTIQIDGENWEVLIEWLDLDAVHLVFCVRYPKSEQKPPPGVSS